MSDDIEYPRFKHYAWIGPQLMSDNGLQLSSIVTEEHDGTYHAGTRCGPIGLAMPEFGHEELFITKDYRNKDEAIFAARKDTSEVLRGCNEVHKEHKAEKLIEKATTPAAKETARPRGHMKLVIDR
jgi:hypothetical protein